MLAESTCSLLPPAPNAGIGPRYRDPATADSAAQHQCEFLGVHAGNIWRDGRAKPWTGRWTCRWTISMPGGNTVPSLLGTKSHSLLGITPFADPSGYVASEPQRQMRRLLRDRDGGGPGPAGICSGSERSPSLPPDRWC